MLDKSDLTAIGSLIKTGNDSVKQELRQEISGVKQELRQEISGVKQELKTEFSKQLKKEISPLKKDVKKIKFDIETIIGFFDNEYLNVNQRVKKIEKHLGLPTPEFKLISPNR